MLSGCSKVTIESLKRNPIRHEELVSLSYFHGAGMMGDTLSFDIHRDKDNSIRITTKSSKAHYFPIRVYEYEVKNDKALEELKQYIDEYNLCAWNDLKYSEIYALDGPTTSYSMLFRDNGKHSKAYRISYDEELPEKGGEVLNHLKDMMYSYAERNNLIETYLEDNDNRIYCARDIKNTEEEIDKLLLGYWFYNDSNIVVEWLGRTDDRVVRINSNDNSWPGGNELVVKEIIHEPLKDYNSSWYVLLDDQGIPVYMTLDTDEIVLLRQEDEFRFIRN